MRRPPLPSTAEEAPPAEKKEVKPEPRKSHATHVHHCKTEFNKFQKPFSLFELRAHPTLLARELTDDEKTKILSSEDFGQFMSKSSRLIERAMDEVNIFTDYGGDDDLEKDRWRCYIIC